MEMKRIVIFQIRQINLDNENNGPITVKPLANLKKNITNVSDKNHYVILSAGSNDFSSSFSSNPPGPLKIFLTLFNIRKNYLKILKEIQKLGNSNIKPILVLPYRPNKANSNNQTYLNLTFMGHLHGILQCFLIGIALSALKKHNIHTCLKIISVYSCVLFVSTRQFPLKNLKHLFSGQTMGVSIAGHLLEKIYQPIIDLAKKEGIPVLDLTNTFNPENLKLYSHNDSPSEQGGKIIAKGLSHIICDYENNKGKIVSGLLDMDNDVSFDSKSIQTNDWKVIYPIKKNLYRWKYKD